MVDVGDSKDLHLGCDYKLDPSVLEAGLRVAARNRNELLYFLKIAFCHGFAMVLAM